MKTGWELGLFTIVKKKKLRDMDLINMYIYLMELWKEHGAMFFSVVSSVLTRGSEHRLNNSNFHLNVGENFFTLKDDWTVGEIA